MTTSTPTVHFVVGVPRGGTTFLLRRLHQHSSVMGFGESRFFGNSWVEPADDGRYDAAQLEIVRERLLANRLDTNLPRPEDPRGRPGWIDHIDSAQAQTRVAALFSSMQAPQTPNEVFRAVCGALAEGSGATTVVEKTPHHLRHIDRLVEHFPDARIVIVVRDPYDFLLSYKHAKEIRGEDAAAHEEMLWQATGVSLLWRSYIRAAFNAERRLGDRVHLVRLEHISADPARELDSIQRFLGLDAEDLLAGAPQRDNSSFTGERAELAAADVAACNLVCRADIEMAGYEVRESGLSRLGAYRAAAGVVPWALRNARSAAARTDQSLFRYAMDAAFVRRR